MRSAVTLKDSNTFQPSIATEPSSNESAFQTEAEISGRANRWLSFEIPSRPHVCLLWLKQHDTAKLRCHLVNGIVHTPS
jgi:hypothetical protein